MKISELMAGATPNASYEGWVSADGGRGSGCES